MAIDLMVMPLSKYFSGDYVTPAMMDSWESGVEYSVVYPEETITYPEGMPWGGENSQTERAEMLPHIVDSISNAPFGIGDNQWSEDSSYNSFFRVSPSSLEALEEEFEKVFTPHKITSEEGIKEIPAHFANASIFLPVDFPNLFKWIDDLTFGSLYMLKNELTNQTWASSSSDAYCVWESAINDAIKNKLPLIVDA